MAHAKQDLAIGRFGNAEKSAPNLVTVAHLIK